MIIGLVTFVLLDIPTFFREWFYAVYLTPKKIQLGPSDWAAVKQIQVVNNNRYPIYSVQLRIYEKTKGSNIDAIQIQPVSERHLIERIGQQNGYEIDLNAFVISGHTKDGLRWKRAFINKVNQNSEIDIKITIPASKRKADLKLKITNFEKEAAGVLQKEGAVAMSFKIID